MLFDTCRIGRIETNCRIIRSATFEGMGRYGVPTENLTKMYEKLADGGAGIIITGMMATNKMEPRQHCQIRIDDDQCIEPLAKVTQHVHDHGSKVVAQLVVMGSAILLPEVPEGEERFIFSPSGVTEKVAKWTQESKALTIDQIHELIEAVARAAKRAQEAGFDGVQFHGAHGYLASKFLSPHFNTRTDEYGGSLENRARFLLEAIAAMRKSVGPDYPIWVKLNCADFMKDGSLTFEESKQVMTWLAEEGVDAIEVSGGNTSSLPRKGPIRAIKRTKEPMYFKNYAAEAASLLKGKIDIGVVGGFRSAEEMEQALSETDLAFISMSRPFLRQPDLPKRWREGDTEPSLCISCSRCFGAENVDCIFNKREKENQEV
ncbi:MAG: NADH:flavin oxidoreductase [Megasphaera massiliensis]|uniref:NADH:flavin oxidoreductase n=2 Tax=Megasphaera massiliensis TaxID=1232428 RepID=UPI00210E58DD|nr:NADH:flavin oxidoreductase [Megasphaera massiliensis]MCQ5210162.1 NADH:flavin oxidoreductase [Megasphaera massiliensis]MEE0658259.1 NADH:flavin oxidoreductase [Megasphaera massiliensis]